MDSNLNCINPMSDSMTTNCLSKYTWKTRFSQIVKFATLASLQEIKFNLAIFWANIWKYGMLLGKFLKVWIAKC